MSQYGVISGPYFPVFVLNTEIYYVFGHFSRSESDCLELCFCRVAFKTSLTGNITKIPVTFKSELETLFDAYVVFMFNPYPSFWGSVSLPLTVTTQKANACSPLTPCFSNSFTGIFKRFDYNSRATSMQCMTKFFNTNFRRMLFDGYFYKQKIYYYRNEIITK